jgi:hypothetical protein
VTPRSGASASLALLVGMSLLAPPAALAQAAAGSPTAVSLSIERMEAGAVQWLAQQMVPNPTVPAPESSRRRLLLSYRVPPEDPAFRYVYGRSAIYDDALGAIAFTMVGRYREAEFLLGAITRLVRADGGLWFAYNTQNDWPSETDHEGAIVRTGAVAWAGYALSYYLQARALETPEFGSKDPLGIQFLSSAESIARWLLARQAPAGSDPRAELLTGGSGSAVLAFPDGAAGPTEISSAAPVEWVSTEHNIDAWYFLRDLGRLTGEARYSAAAERIRARVLTLWSEKDGQFIQGIHADRTPDTALPLDAASWGAIFLRSQGRDAQADRCLQVMESRFAVRVGDVRGYRPYGREPVYTDARVNAYYYPGGGMLWSDLPLVWCEGSLGAAAAYIRAGRAAEARLVMESQAGLAVDGGFRYASMPVPYQFSDYPSVASTAWLVIAAQMLRGSPAGGLFWGK